MATRSKPAAPSPPLEIASGVFFLEVGKGFMRSNVYFVRSGSSWVLIDAASARCAPAIRAGAASVFGVDSAPSAILLTHSHPDHDGSARELATILEMPALRASRRAPDRLWRHRRHREVCESVGSLADTAFPAASRGETDAGPSRAFQPGGGDPSARSTRLRAWSARLEAHPHPRPHARSCGLLPPPGQGLDHRRRPADEGSELPFRVPFRRDRRWPDRPGTPRGTGSWRSVRPCLSPVCGRWW